MTFLNFLRIPQPLQGFQVEAASSLSIRARRWEKESSLLPIAISIPLLLLPISKTPLLWSSEHRLPLLLVSLPHSLLTSAPGLPLLAYPCHHSWWCSTLIQMTFPTLWPLNPWHVYLSLHFATVTSKISNSRISSSVYNLLTIHLFYPRSPVVITPWPYPDLQSTDSTVFFHVANDYIFQTSLQLDMAREMW